MNKLKAHSGLAEPDTEYLKLEEGLLRALAVGRPFGVADQTST